MLIHNAEHTFYYIDPSLEAGGDGSSVATAANAFPAEMNTDNVIYLVRRTSIDTPANFTPHNSSSQKTFSNVKSFVMMGMPKQDDELFASMPEDAKAAWIDADQEYAQVKMPGNGRYSVNFNACTNFFMYRVCFMNQKDNSSYDIVASHNKGCNVRLDRCWFRAFNADFTAEGVSTSPSYHSGTRWLAFNRDSIATRGNSAKITQCRFDKWGEDDSIRLGYIHNVYINDCEFHLSQTSNDTSVIEWYYDEYKWCAEVYAKNLKGYYYFNNNRDQYVPSMLCGCCKRVFVDTVTLEKGTHQNHSAYNNRLTFTRTLDFKIFGAGSVIQNVTVNAPDVVGSGSTIVYMRKYMNDNDPGRSMVARGQYNVVRNVTINFAESYETENLLHEQYDWEENISTNEYALVHVTSDGDYNRQCATDYLLQNVHIKAPMGKAIRAWYTMFDMADCDVHGCIQAAQSLGKIKSITTWRPGYAFYDNGCNTFYIGEITCNKDNPRWEYIAQYAVTPSYHSYLLVGKSNIRCYPNKYDDSFSPESYTYECNYICTNDQMDGAYFARNMKSKAETWSTYRQGSSSNCSIRLTNEEQDDRYWPLLVGGVPFKGITQHVTAGVHTLTFYVTMYGYNDYSEIVDRFHAVIELPNGERVFSEEGSWQLDEDSVWENLDGYTSYKLTIPFSMDEEGDISTSFQWSWYMVGAATFVDPFPTVA